jgi:hypothetical protein
MIDEEIRGALDVDPSPEFLARVRTRLATEPAPSAWRWSWTIVAAGALAAAAIMAIVLTPAREKATPATQTAEAGPKGPALRETEPARSPAVRKPGPSLLERRPRPSGPGEAIASRQPEILLDAAETRALRALIAGVRDGRVDITAAQNSRAPAPTDLEPITDIVIAPLSIEPLAPQGAQGERQ